MKQDKKITDYVRKHYQSMTDSEIAKKLGVHRLTIFKTRKRLGLPACIKPDAPLPVIKKSPKESIDYDRQRKQAEAEKKFIQQKYQRLLDENSRLQKQFEMLNTIPKVNSYRINPVKPLGDNEATAVVLASDWHLGEVVRKEQVNGLNEFNPEIAKLRVEEFFSTTARMVQIFSKEIPIPNLVLALLGDFINGYIHDDARETNSMPPMLEVEFAQQLIVSGIEFLLRNTDCNLIIPCSSGNHAKTTMKGRVSNEAGVSLEYLMYCNIARFFKGNERVQFIIEEGYHTIVQIYDKKVRFHHGHDIRYQGGIGSLLIPLNKAIAQWNKAVNVDYDCLGHWHSYFNSGNAIVNGSIIGYNAFAIMIKANYEKPKQAFFLIDKNRSEKTITTPILFSK